MKIRRIFLMTALAAALIITSVVPVLAETAVNDPNAAEEDVLLSSQAPDAGWTTSGLKAAKVNLTSVKSYRYDKIKLTWEPLSGVDDYQIYRATSKSGTYSKVNSITGASKSTYINGSRTCGKTYYYKVRAYKKIGGKTVYSKYSSVMSGKAVPSKTTVVGAWGSAGTILGTTVEWKGIAGATDYEVQTRYTLNGKTTSWNSKVKTRDDEWLPFKTHNQFLNETKKKYPSGYVTGVVLAGYPEDAKIPVKEYAEKRIKSNSASLSGLPQDDRVYEFRVRAYRTVNGKKVYGAWSEPYTMVETLDVDAAYKELKQYAIDYAAKNYPEWKYDDREIYHGIDADASYYNDGVFGGSSRYARQEDFVENYKDDIARYIRRMKNSGGQQEGFIYIKKSRPGDTEGIHENYSDETYYVVWMLL